MGERRLSWGGAQQAARATLRGSGGQAPAVLFTFDPVSGPALASGGTKYYFKRMKYEPVDELG